MKKYKKLLNKILNFLTKTEPQEAPTHIYDENILNNVIENIEETEEFKELFNGFKSGKSIKPHPNLNHIFFYFESDMHITFFKFDPKIGSITLDYYKIIAGSKCSTYAELISLDKALFYLKVLASHKVRNRLDNEAKKKEFEENKRILLGET